MVKFQVLSLIVVLSILCRSISSSISSDITSKLFFYENFDIDPFQSGKWVKSTNSKYSNQPVEIRPVKG